MADTHAERDHATWSASATERNWNCAGALALTHNLPEDTNEAADWGTACHQVSEKCFSTGKDAADFIGTVEKGKKYEFVVDDEMADTAQAYVDYCRGRRDQYKAETGGNAIVFVEEHFSLASLNPPFDAGGTGDFVLWFPKWELLEVVDLKTGRGVVVEVKGNKQGRSYGLGVALKHQGYKAKRIKVTIVQTRAAHKDGRIRSEEFSIADLIEWTSELLDKMRQSKAAEVARAVMSPAEWSAKYLKPGTWCSKTFCKAQGFCPALEQKAIDEAGVWFDDLDRPQLANTPELKDPDARRNRLDMLELIEGWIKGVRAWEHAQAENGDLPTDYILVETEGREKFKDEAATVQTLTDAGVPTELFLNAPKAKTPKQVRAELAKKKNGMADKLALLEGASETPRNGTNLVRASKTTRPAITPGAGPLLESLDGPPANLFD